MYYNSYSFGCENKMRISLSTRALSIIQEDMDVFNEKSIGAFINTIFYNFRGEANASVNILAQKKRNEYEKALSNCNLPDITKNLVLNALENMVYDSVQKAIVNSLAKGASGSESKLYYINNANMELLEKMFPSEPVSTPKNRHLFYKRKSQYMKCLLEEYSELPFIERERIVKKSIINTIEDAISSKTYLDLTTKRGEKKTSFYVKPYKILSDPLNTRSYLVCWSRPEGSNAQTMTIRSYAIHRLNKVELIRDKWDPLSTRDVHLIEEKIAHNSSAFLSDETETIRIKISPEGESIYHVKLAFRPKIIKKEGDIYIFTCSPKQAFNYFFNFGDTIEILEPITLREEFKNKYTTASKLYL